MKTSHKPYHINFSAQDLGEKKPNIALLSGEPERSKLIAYTYLNNARLLSDYRGLNSYVGTWQRQPILVATSGMGAPSLSIVVNELVQVGITHFIRLGTCGAIQPYIKLGSLVISQGALCRQGAANDIAPVEYPAVANPFLTVALVKAAQTLEFDYHLGVTASVDTFYEGQERREMSANSYLQPSLQGITQAYRHLGILNYEMEAGTLLKMASVYGVKAACVCVVIAQRTEQETILLENKGDSVNSMIQVALQSLTYLESFL